MTSKIKNRPRICVVDSHPADYRGLSAACSRERTRVELFETGRAALRRHPGKPPGAWVVNIQLPDIDGPDLMEMLRERFPGVPVYMVSDDNRPEQEIAARQSGADLYLCKP